MRGRGEIVIPTWHAQPARVRARELGAAQYNAPMDSASPDTDTVLRKLVDEYRQRCLWFLQTDYYPSTIAEAQRVLDAIQRHGDRDGFQRAAQVREWLSQASSATSAGS